MTGMPAKSRSLRARPRSFRRPAGSPES